MAEEVYVLHRTYCMDCNKTMQNSSISHDRAIRLVDSPKNLFERYWLLDKPNLVGGVMLLEESCCDECYQKQEEDFGGHDFD